MASSSTPLDTTAIIATAKDPTAQWSSKEIHELDNVADLIPNGSAIYIGSGPATPDATLNAVIVSIFHLLSFSQK